MIPSLSRLYSQDYVILNSDGMPIEGLDVIYHYTAIIDEINSNGKFLLNEGCKLVKMTDLSVDLQEKYKV
jgi:hypothetical protein